VQTKRYDEFDNSHANKEDSACLRTKHQVSQSNALGEKLTCPVELHDHTAVQKQRFDRSDKVRHQVSQINTHGQRLLRYDQLSEPKPNVVVSEEIKQLKHKSVQLHDDNIYQLNHTPRQNMLKPPIVTQQVHDTNNCVVNECLRGDIMLFDGYQSKMPVVSPQIIKSNHESAQVGVICSKPKQRVLKKYDVEKRVPVQRNQMSYNSTRIKTDMSDEFLKQRQDFESFKHENISDNSQNRRVGYFTSSGNKK